VALETTDPTGIYLWGTSDPGRSGYLGYSQDQGATWYAGVASPPNGYADQYGNAQILHILHTRDDYNPVRQVDITIPTPAEDPVSKWRGLDASDWIGQSFSPGATLFPSAQRHITGFAFGGNDFNYFELNGGKIWGRLYLADIDDFPIGDPIASVEADIDEIGGFAKVDFGTPIPLDDTYYVATLEVDSEVTGNWLGCYAITNPYVNGRAIHGGGGGPWAWITGPEDWKFRTFHNQPALCGDGRHQLPTGDLNQDCYVNWADFGVFASHWLESGCTEPYRCQGADLDDSGEVNWADFGVFAGGWLDCTDPNPPCSFNP